MLLFSRCKFKTKQKRWSYYTRAYALFIVGTIPVLKVKGVCVYLVVIYLLFKLFPRRISATRLYVATAPLNAFETKRNT